MVTTMLHHAATFPTVGQPLFPHMQPASTPRLSTINQRYAAIYGSDDPGVTDEDSSPWSAVRIWGRYPCTLVPSTSNCIFAVFSTYLLAIHPLATL